MRKTIHRIFKPIQAIIRILSRLYLENKEHDCCRMKVLGINFISHKIRQKQKAPNYD